MHRMLRLITKDLEYKDKSLTFKLFLFLLVNFPDSLGVSELDREKMKMANPNVALIISPSEEIAVQGGDYRDLSLIDKGLGIRWIINCITDWCVNGVDDKHQAELELVKIVRNVWDTFEVASEWATKDQEIQELEDLWHGKKVSEE